MSGSGIGYLVIPLLFNQLIEKSSWRMCLLIYSGPITLILVLACLTFKPIVAQQFDLAVEDLNQMLNSNGEFVNKSQIFSSKVSFILLQIAKCFFLFLG